MTNDPRCQNPDSVDKLSPFAPRCCVGIPPRIEYSGYNYFLLSWLHANGAGKLTYKCSRLAQVLMRIPGKLAAWIPPMVKCKHARLKGAAERDKLRRTLLDLPARVFPRNFRSSASK